ncbi:phosphate/phosphite/phosphonate ABC transporter substrate-binding protein [Roseibium polysiphoniae]|uniref:Phosphate/phosphite/phosphonate ABC transporter substrate-binding protein n=1 Tax=Roseibium polysiphoniae TaxID=2571221 RepID=A0ABR9CBA6_9HYPH|nr:phosphate/phosphite/phosphonate ABC transporter substrate-binding protein [Roseibium polysiphoniae]MBD8877170.1 phosphate/phosphite/phosphonate ABC transporter substrate-binding protein [Roseibium polysiphoniae]
MTRQYANNVAIAVNRQQAQGKLLLLSSALFLCALCQSAMAEKIYSFGIVPQQSASRLAQVWVPILAEIEKETGYKLRFTTAKDIPTFETCLATKAYDFAYMNPYHYTVVHETAGYEAFAHQADKKLKGILVARADSQPGDLGQLNQQAIAFPSPAAFGASVIPRAELTAQNIEFEPVYVKSHDSVYRAVALGLFPAGGGVMRTFNNLPDDLKSQLKIIYQTDAYTPHAFTTSPSLPQEVRGKVIAAMMQLEDASLLKPLGMTGFVSASNETWDDVRALQLTANQTEIASAGEETCHSN